MIIFMKLAVFLLGLLLVLLTIASAIQTFVLPRGAVDLITGTVFRFIRLANAGNHSEIGSSHHGCVEMEIKVAASWVFSEIQAIACLSPDPNIGNAEPSFEGTNG